MKWIDVIRMAAGNLRRNLLRSFLTISGVVIGIATIVFLVSLGFGLQQLAIDKVANLDALTLLTVNPSNKEGTLLDKEAVDKFSKIQGVSIVSPMVSFPAQISKKGLENTGDTVLYGVDPKNLNMEDVKADYGKTELSGENANEVILSIASLKNMNLTDPDKILNTELDFTVVQVDQSGNSKREGEALKLKIVGLSKDENTKFAYIPINLLKGYDVKLYSSVKLRVAQRDDMANVRKTVESMGYPTSSVKDTVDQISSIFTIIQGVLGGFGLIALFVAAIGIFNTLTISLLERTHEIGIMKAIGGRDRDVARIFTIEASLIGLIGGILGVMTGWLIGIGLNWIINFIATSVGGEANSLFMTPISFAFMVIGFSFAVSTFAGIWPARRAAKLDPLEALRYE